MIILYCSGACKTFSHHDYYCCCKACGTVTVEKEGVGHRQKAEEIRKENAYLDRYAY